MKKGVIVFIISIFIFSFANLVFAGLGGSCTIMPIASGCTGGEFVDMLYFSHANNAHACYDSNTNCYDYGICCLSSDTMRFSPTGVSNFQIFSLADLTNSHVGEKGVYSNNFQFSGAGGGYCSVVSGSCSGDDICLFSMSGLENAHAGQCGSYGINVCCDPEAPPTVLLVITSIVGDDVVVLDDGENQQISVNLIDSTASPVSGATVTIFVYNSTGALFDSETVLSDINGIATGSSISFASGDVGDYIVNATAVKGGYVSDEDGDPVFNFEVIQTANILCVDQGGICCVGNEVCIDDDTTNADDCSVCCLSSCEDPGSNPGSDEDTFIGWGECEDDGNGDAIGIRKVYLYNSTTGILIGELDPEDCFLGEEEIPFFGYMAFIIFLFILGIFYYSEIFKSKKNVKNNKRVK